MEVLVFDHRLAPGLLLQFYTQRKALFKDALQKRLRRRFFVTPKSGLNFAGVLTEYDRGENGYGVYQDVVVYPPDSTPEPVEGVTFIRHSNVAYVQELPPEFDAENANE